MNIKKIISSLFFFGVMACGAYAQQPYGGCWHPDYIKNWTPANDVDAKFNRSTVALQPRFQDLTLKANPYQFYDGKVSACLTMNPMCSQTPSQDANNFIGYNPTYWQYMDVLVWWGGSAGEGIIIPPSAPVTDIAHLNGVKVLGQVFFPPSAFGGQQSWVIQMLTKEGDAYPYAKKLYDIAKYYGFDGWFINEETGGGSQSQWTEFIAYFNKCAQDDGNSKMEIQWYDCGTSASGVSSILKTPGASYFANYGSANSSTISSNMSTVQGLGFTKAEAFSKVYHGIECAQGGIGGNATSFQACFPKEGHAGSIDLFNPEEGAWKQVVTNLLGTENACGSQAYTAMNSVFANESRFWTNKQADPTSGVDRDNSSTWPGFANGLMERTTIQNKPFVTSFSAGLGKARYVNGEKKGTQDWYHRGMQSIMPTWRWWIESSVKGEIGVTMNWDDAYNMGTSLVVKGKLSANVDHITRLYKTKLTVAAGDKFQLVYKTNNANSMEVKLGVSESDNSFETFPIAETTTNNGWSVATVDISSLAGKTISVIALNFKASAEVADYQTQLGQLSVVSGSYAPAASLVENLATQSALKETLSDIRLIWNAPVSAEVSHYNVYLERNGVKALVGQTRNEGFYIPKFQRASSEEKNLKVYVTAVTKDMKEGAEASLQMDYPVISAPVVQLKALKTLVKTNEVVAVVARATNYPTTYEWTVPANAEITRQSADTAYFKFKTPGLYDIAVKVSNASGSTEEKNAGYIEVSDSKELNLVSVGKLINASSGFLSPESPEKIIDGVKVPSDVHGKWCAGGKKEHWVIVDLKEMYKIYRFQTYDCGNKENSSDNFKNFKIELSNDAANWTEVLNEKARPENTKSDYIKPTEGRYVRFTPYDEEMPITIRIWEFEVYGVQGNLELQNPADAVAGLDTTIPVELAYSLGGDPKESNFAMTVVSSNPDLLSIANVSTTDSKVNFDMLTKSVGGKANVTVKLTNGKWSKEVTYTVKVQDPSLINIVSKLVPTVQTADSYDENNDPVGTNGAIGEAGITDGLTSTWWSSAYYNSSAGPHFVKFALNDSYQITSFRALYNSHGYLKLPTNIKIWAAEVDQDNAYTLVANMPISVSDNEFFPTAPFNAKFLKLEIAAVPYYGFSLAEFEAYGKKVGGGVGIINTENNTNFRVYPNPIHNGEILKVEAADATKVQLISLQGSILVEELVNNGVAMISIQGLASGTYLVRSFGDSGICTKKVIVK